MGYSLLLFSRTSSPPGLLLLSLCYWCSHTWHHCFPGRGTALASFQGVSILEPWKLWPSEINDWNKCLSWNLRCVCSAPLWFILDPSVLWPSCFQIFCHFRPWVLELLFMLTCCSTRISTVWFRLCLQNGLYWRDSHGCWRNASPDLDECPLGFSWCPCSLSLQEFFLYRNNISYF